MNVSLRSFSNDKAVSLIQITNTRFDKLSISNFFVSRSTSPLFTSFNNKIKKFSLSSSLFNKYLNPVTNIRCSSTDNSKHSYKVERTIIMNSISNTQGSGLCCKNPDLQVYVSSCTFINCTSKVSGSSSQRDNGVSGGACLFSVGEVIMKSVMFESCVGESLGSAVYASTIINNRANVSYLCDVNCGKDTTSIHSIYAFELCTTTARNINSTNSISKSIYGAIHLGKYPKTFSVKYLSIKAQTSANTAIPLGMGLHDGTDTGYIDHAFFSGCKYPNGLMTLWKGIYVLDDIVFSECSGKLYYVADAIKSISFKNSFFSPMITMLSATTDDSCKMTETETVVLTKCTFYQKSNYCSIKKMTRTLPNFPLYIILMI